MQRVCGDTNLFMTYRRMICAVPFNVVHETKTHDLWMKTSETTRMRNRKDTTSHHML